MSSKQSGALVNLYSTKIGKPASKDEVYGYWLFVIGLIASVLGVLLFFASESSAQMIRGAGIALGAFGLLLIVAGPILRLHLRKSATYLTYLGVLIGLVAIAWFLTVYPDNWVRGAEQADMVIGVYGVGLAVVALGGIVVPLVTELEEPAVEDMEEELAAERRAREEAEEKLEAERRARQETAETLEAEQAAREEAEEEAEAERRQREASEAELAQIRDSQSQFELYEDAAGEYRWRLRHRNSNLIATSGEGYSSRQKAQQGLAGVRRDAVGAPVVDIDRTEATVKEPDDATDGEDAPPLLQDADSQATFEQYEDNAGEYRWRLVHENGNIIGDGGEGYASRSGIERAVSRVREYVKPADYLEVDPVAFELYRDNAGEYRWRLIHENGNNLGDGGEGYASRQKAIQGIESVKANAPEGGDAEFEIYEDNRGKYRWRLVHDNGNLIADSGQGYTSESGAEDAVSRIREYAPEAPHLDIGTAAFEIFEDSAEEYRWRLRHRNGNTLADSGEGYGSRGRAEDAVVRVKRHAPDADAEWIE